MSFDPSLEEALAQAIAVGNEQPMPKEEVRVGDGIDPHRVFLIPGQDGQQARVVVEPAPEYRPEVKRGSVVVLDPESFGTYYNVHKEPGTKVEAFLGGGAGAAYKTPRIMATIDGHSAEFAGRQAHTLTLQCQYTPEWAKIKALSGHEMSQEAFAEFLDDMAHCFSRPSAADLAEIVLNLEGKNDVTWSSKLNRVTGGVQVAYSEDVTLTMKQGIVFPTQGEIVAPVFEGSRPEQYLVKFRYRVKDGGLKVLFVVDQFEKIEREAFNDIVSQVKLVTGASVLMCP